MNALAEERKIVWPPPRKLVFNTVMQGLEPRKEALRVERSTSRASAATSQ